MKFNISISKVPSNVTVGQVDGFIFYNSSIEIDDFSPKHLPIAGETIVQIKLNRISINKIIRITLADVPCLILNFTKDIFCQSNQSSSSRIGLIQIHFENSSVVSSKDQIEYRQLKISAIDPTVAYQYPGRSLHLYGENFLLGNLQEIFLGSYQCSIIERITMNNITCRLPKLAAGSYHLTVLIDKKPIENPNEILLKVTENPTIEDIYPLTSFARYAHVHRRYSIAHLAFLVEED